MADKKLQDRIVKLLNAKPKKTESVAKIVQTLRVPKKSLNNQLYKLQREGRVNKVGESPPVWALQGGFAITGARATRSKRISGNFRQNKKGDDILESKILEFLKGKKKPSKSLDIAKGTGHSRSTDVNASLYKLLKEGLIDKIAVKPPTWALNTRSETLDTEDPSILDFKTSADNNPSGSQPSGSYITEGQGIPIFQETELFKTEPQFESETSVKEELDDGTEKENVVNTSHLRTKRNEHVRGIESSFTESSLGGESAAFSPSVSDTDLSTQGSFKLFERFGDSRMTRDDPNDENNESDSDLECDGESEVNQEEGTEESEERFRLKAYEVEQGGSNMYNIERSKAESNEPIQMEADDENYGKELSHETPEFDRDNVKKPKSFRDVFGLDDSMSDDSSNSFDSAEDIEAEFRDEDDSNDNQNVTEFAMAHRETENEDGSNTPEIQTVVQEKATPDQSISTREWNTPQLLEGVLALEEDMSLAAKMEGQASYENENSDGCSEALLNAPVRGRFANTEHALEAKDEISQVEMEEDSEKPSGKLVDETEEMVDENEADMTPDETDMEDCDKVLKVLHELKGIAQFVLKRKTDIPPEDLDDVLQKCLSLNYVSGSSKLWKITEDGTIYISKRIGESNTLKEHEMHAPPERKVKSTFKGPPPPPKTLLKKEEKGVSGNISDRLRKHDAKPSFEAFTSHSPNSLFKPPPPRVSNSSLKSAGSFMSTSGPQPLMSIKFDSNSSNKSEFSEQNKVSSQSSVSQFKPPSLMSIQCDPSKTTNYIPPQCNSNQGYSYQESDTLMEAAANSQKYADSEMMKFDQNQEMLNSNLWGTGASSLNVYNVNTKSQVLNENVNTFTSKSVPGSVQAPSPRNQAAPVQQRAQSLSGTEEVQQREIPSKYADYPNQNTSLQCLKSMTSSKTKSMSIPRSKSDSAFKKGPPPSPFDILSKSLKKTEISPPSSYKEKISVSHSSGSFSTMSQTVSNKSTGNRSQSLENKSVFSAGQFSQSGSSNLWSGNKSEKTAAGNQSSFTQSGSIFGIQSGQTGFQRSSLQSLPPNVSSRGPPPPPAVKLGLLTQQPAQRPVLVAQPVQVTPKLNLGLSLNTESFNALNKNPVSALMEYAQSRKLTARVEVLSRRGSSHKPTFEMAAFVGDRRFPSVTCHNKKDGRKEACDIAMRQLVADGQFQAEKAAASSNMSSITPVPSANMTHFDTIAALTHRGFTALVSQITAESMAGRKVIAGLVMKRSADDTGVLISLGTGNRCITGQQMSLQGNTVNDSHAEIITRRGFIRFLYKQLLEYDPSRPHPMFEKSPSGKLQMRPNITFHLYISTAPCGDGALFSPRDAESAKAPTDSRLRPPHEPTFSSNVQGLLRTKVEGGEGTIPIEPGFKSQTFDGIQRGERLRTMSCTDKICRWNVVGMQGALLSYFLEPVYLDSLTLGLLYDHGHLCRAVCCRVGRGQVDVDTELPPGYKLNHPWLGRVTVCDPPREVQKTKALSINWCFGDQGPEVTDGTQGLCYTSIEKGFFSRCSKHNLFISFKELCEKFGRRDLLQVSSYNEAKMAAADFVDAKQTMLRRFKDNGFGKWVSKPVEEEMFGFDEKN